MQSIIHLWVVYTEIKGQSGVTQVWHNACMSLTQDLGVKGCPLVLLMSAWVFDRSVARFNFVQNKIYPNYHGINLLTNGNTQFKYPAKPTLEFILASYHARSPEKFTHIRNIPDTNVYSPF